MIEVKAPLLNIQILNYKIKCHVSSAYAQLSIFLEQVTLCDALTF